MQATESLKRCFNTRGPRFHITMLNIPGFFYDKERKKYFKITNGASESNYHNNIVQKEKRKRLSEFNTTHNDRYNKNAQVSKRILEKIVHGKRSVSATNLISLKLGLFKKDRSTLAFEKLKHLTCVKEFECTYDKIYKSAASQEIFLVNKNNEGGILIDLRELLTSSNMEIFKNSVPIFDGTSEGHIYNNESLDDIFLTNGDFLFRYRRSIGFSSDGNTSIPNEVVVSCSFRQFRNQNVNTPSDILISFIKDLKNEDALKLELSKLFNYDINVFENDNFRKEEQNFIYNKMKSMPDEIVKCGFMQSNFLLIGTDRGKCYEFEYSTSGEIINCKKMLTLNSQQGISNVLKLGTIIMISAGNKMYSVDQNLRVRKLLFLQNEHIKHFSILENGSTLLVGNKSISLQNFKFPKDIASKLPYTNHNISNQCYAESDDFCLVNESDESAIAVCKSNWGTFRVRLSTPKCAGKLVSMAFISKEFLLVSRSSDKRKYLQLFKFGPSNLTGIRYEQ